MSPTTRAAVLLPYIPRLLLYCVPGMSYSGAFRLPQALARKQGVEVFEACLPRVLESIHANFVSVPRIAVLADDDAETGRAAAAYPLPSLTLMYHNCYIL